MLIGAQRPIKINVREFNLLIGAKRPAKIMCSS